MSKKLIYIRITIVIICLILIGIFIFIINNIHKTVDIKDNVIEETKEKRIIFDMTLPPNQQKNLRGHVDEYMQQVYEYLFPDIKIRKMIDGNELSYSDLKQEGDTKGFYDWVSSWADGKVFGYVFTENNDFIIPLVDLPVTDKYMQNHPLPLRQEYKKYFKDDYEEVKDNGKFKHLFTYEYSIGIDREKKQVEIEVKKNINFYDEDMGIESGVLWGKKGSKYEGYELYDTLRKIYFDYTLDEKGYLDDVKYSHTQIITDEKEFDNSCPDYT